MPFKVAESKKKDLCSQASMKPKKYHNTSLTSKNSKNNSQHLRKSIMTEAQEPKNYIFSNTSQKNSAHNPRQFITIGMSQSDESQDFSLL